MNLRKLNFLKFHCNIFYFCIRLFFVRCCQIRKFPSFKVYLLKHFQYKIFCIFQQVSLNTWALFKDSLSNTGLFKANLYTLNGDCDKYVMCTEKNVLGLFSVNMEISFHSNKSEKSNSFIVKNWIGNLNHFFLKIQLTILRLFEANMVSRVPY